MSSDDSYAAPTSADELAVAVLSIARTQRRRFFWAAWWSGSPHRAPFRPPDASAGGFATYEDALAHAQASTGRAFRTIESLWAHAVLRTLRGERPWPSMEQAPRKSNASESVRPLSARERLGVPKNATEDQIKRAFRERALRLHPDHGGDPSEFRALYAAYRKLIDR